MLEFMMGRVKEFIVNARPALLLARLLFLAFLSVPFLSVSHAGVKYGHGDDITAYVSSYYTVRNHALASKHIFAGNIRMASRLVEYEHEKEHDEDHDGRHHEKGHDPGHEAVFYYHGDHLGSNHYITDERGRLHEHLEYFPFGEQWVEEGEESKSPLYRFTAKELDPETGLYYFGARYYDPRTSVWISADPILGKLLSSSGGTSRLTRKLSLFAYTQQNPLFFKDPDGNDEQDAIRTLTTFRETIISSANKENIPPLLLGDIIYQEQLNLAPLEKFTDSIKAIFSDKTSLGPGQIQIQTAAALLGLDAKKLTSEQRAKVVDALKDSKSNIGLAAKLLRQLKNQKNRYPTIAPSELGQNDKANRRRRGIIATEYNIGPTGSPEERAKPGPYGRKATAPEREQKVSELLKPNRKND